ncbi:hypothetical protein [Oceanospirillum sediminis]|uniref:Uncharacterized protein n=1 Tax=Oceanospirillum sediminis TaxID=2760088 RepID=A0A839ITL6_9GAMM|nr:hypothetical protein [Oceanospirillum sediminis]MBB1488665.1 hypothetical protein [Oceanospirillum sediminis]
MRLNLKGFFLFMLLSGSVMAGPVEDVLLLCRGTASVTALSDQIKASQRAVLDLSDKKQSLSGHKKKAGSVSEQDVIRLLQKQGPAGDSDSETYSACIQNLAPSFLGRVASIDGRTVQVYDQGYPGFVKLPIRHNAEQKSENVSVSLNNIDIDDDQIRFNFRFFNKTNGNKKVRITKNSFQLLLEDSGQELAPVRFEGLKDRDRQVLLSPKSSKFIAVSFNNPNSKELMRFNSLWSLPSSQINIGLTLITRPLNLHWLHVKSRSYDYAGPFDEQR